MKRMLQDNTGGLVAPSRKLEERLSIKPTRDLIYLDPYTIPENVSANAKIILPETYRESEHVILGRVFAMGPDLITKCSDCNKDFRRIHIGDTVVHKLKAGMTIQWRLADGSFTVIRIITEYEACGTFQSAA